MTQGETHARSNQAAAHDEYICHGELLREIRAQAGSAAQVNVADCLSREPGIHMSQQPQHARHGSWDVTRLKR